MFTHTRYDQRIAKEVEQKNKTLRQLFDRIRKERHDKHMLWVSSRNMLGNDGEATVDGIHFTDLGMMRYANLLYPAIRKAIR